MVYNIEDLQKEYKEGKRYKFLFFWGHTPSKDGNINESCLSQWYSSSFTDGNIVYNCAEQFMMAEKAKLFNDAEMRKQILSSIQPKEMKEFGRCVKNFDKTKWDNECYDIVKKGNIFKFSQNKQLWNYLKETKDRILVEASPRDKIWGIGMGKLNENVENPLMWHGKNLLGFVLTEVRDLLLEKI